MQQKGKVTNLKIGPNSNALRDGYVKNKLAKLRRHARLKWVGARDTCISKNLLKYVVSTISNNEIVRGASIS